MPRRDRPLSEAIRELDGQIASKRREIVALETARRVLEELYPVTPTIKVQPKLHAEDLEEFSVRDAVCKVLSDAHGQPLHVTEILARVQRLNVPALPNDKPRNYLDLILFNLTKEGLTAKTAPATFKWIGPRDS